MERLPHLVGYPRGLSTGEHPDIPRRIALALAGEDGWTDIRHRPEYSLVQKGLAARLIFPFGDGVIVREAWGPRKRFVFIELPAAAAVLAGLIWWAL
ncbi:MAG TPA: hypothetical protein VIQ30_06095 [Pseudonocardia sp.]